MEVLLILLGVIFALAFGARVIWFLIDTVGGFFWSLSGAIIGYGLIVFGFMIIIS